MRKPARIWGKETWLPSQQWDLSLACCVALACARPSLSSSSLVYNYSFGLEVPADLCFSPLLVTVTSKKKEVLELPGPSFRLWASKPIPAPSGMEDTGMNTPASFGKNEKQVSVNLTGCFQCALSSAGLS